MLNCRTLRGQGGVAVSRDTEWRWAFRHEVEGPAMTCLLSVPNTPAAHQGHYPTSMPPAIVLRCLPTSDIAPRRSAWFKTCAAQGPLERGPRAATHCTGAAQARPQCRDPLHRGPLGRARPICAL